MSFSNQNVMNDYTIHKKYLFLSIELGYVLEYEFGIILK